MFSKACEWLDLMRGTMTEDLIAMANQNTGSENLAGLERSAKWLRNWVSFDSALDFSRSDLPPREVVNNQGEVQALPTGPLLRWDFQSQAEQRVLLAIHYDTVFGPESPFQQCKLIGEDKLSGPGVADAKGGVVVLRYALEAVTKFNLAPQLGWTIVLNPDEELGSPSSSGYLRKIAGDFDFGLLFEPALPTGEWVSRRKGSGNFALVVRGRSAHAGRHFQDGRNAVSMLARILCKLDAFNIQRPDMIINVAQFHGGGAVNIVPDLAVGRFNARLDDEASCKWLEVQLEEIVAEADSQEGFQVQLFGGITSPPKLVTPRVQSLMDALESVVQELTSNSIQWRETGGVCDGNKLAAAGLPNVDTLGPIGDGLHSVKEWVQPSSLPEKAKIVVSLLHRYAQGDFHDLRPIEKN